MDKMLLGRFDIFGNQVQSTHNQVIFERFSDGSVRRKVRVVSE
jgi:hypothetical protein